MADLGLGTGGQGTMALPPAAIGGRLMPEYRIYVVNKDNHIDGPPAVVTCDNDERAVREGLSVREWS